MIDRMNSILWAEQEQPYLTTYAGNNTESYVDGGKRVMIKGEVKVKDRADNIMPKKVMFEDEEIKGDGYGSGQDNRLAYEDLLMKKVGGYVPKDDMDKFKMNNDVREVLASISKQLLLHPMSDQDVENLRMLMKDEKLTGGALGPILKGLVDYGPMLAYLAASLVPAGLALYKTKKEAKYDPLKYQSAELAVEKAKREESQQVRDLEEAAKTIKKREQDLIRRENLEKGVPDDVKKLFAQISIK